MSVKLIAGLVLAGLLVLFAVQNAEPVEFRFLICVLLGWTMHAVSTYRERKQPADEGALHERRAETPRDE